MIVERAIKFAQVGLGIVGLILALGFAFSLQAGSVPDVEFVPLPAPERNLAAFSRYAVIGSRNLFQTSDDSPALEMIQEVIADTSLQYKILGTAAGPSDSVVLLEDGRGQKLVLGVGDKIVGEGMVEVERIERGRIVLLNQGRREQLTMEEKAPQAPSLAMLQRGESPVVKITRVPATPRPSEPPPAFLAVATPALLAEVDRRNAPELPLLATRNREFPSQGQRLGRIQPAATGAAPGFSAIAGPVAGPSESAFEAVAGGPLLRKLRGAVELRPGEQIIAVNGVPSNAPDRLPELLRSLLREGPTRVRIAVDSRSEREIEVILP